MASGQYVRACSVVHRDYLAVLPHDVVCARLLTARKKATPQCFGVMVGTHRRQLPYGQAAEFKGGVVGECRGRLVRNDVKTLAVRN